jgi:hypothetical protein
VIQSDLIQFCMYEVIISCVGTFNFALQGDQSVNGALGLLCLLQIGLYWPKCLI